MPNDIENTGRTIVSAIGTTLSKSWTLDHLVERGQDPDPEGVYIYNHHHVWKKDAPFSESRVDLVTGSRKVHKVTRGARGVGYEFEFLDEPGTTYTVNYGWALVLDSPDNVRALEDYRESQRRIRLEQRRLKELLDSISLADATRRATTGPERTMRTDTTEPAPEACVRRFVRRFVGRAYPRADMVEIQSHHGRRGPHIEAEWTSPDHWAHNNYERQHLPQLCIRASGWKARLIAMILWPKSPWEPYQPNATAQATRTAPHDDGN